MIIDEIKGDLFTELSALTAQKIRCHIAHGCNAQGIMGAGFAATVPRRWPTAFFSYKAYCDEKYTAVGTTHIFDYHDMNTGEHVVLLNMITQLFPGRYAQLGHIEKSLIYIDRYVSRAKEHGLWGDEDFVMAPRIGCGFGGLTWNKVRPLIDDCATPFKIYSL